MGKNLYETPRDMNKWHTQKNERDKNQMQSQNNKKTHLEELKKRFRDQNKKG